MTILAVSAIEILRDIPPKTLGIVIGAFIAATIILTIIRSIIAKANGIIVGVIAFAFSVILFSNWIYNRTEPKMLTPMMDRIAPFFPSSASYNVKQQSPNPGK